jgi:hypothetical protein
MAVTRTILARKGLIQSQHGLTGYEADQDANWALLDANVAFISDLQFGDLGINGVISGFRLGVSPTLTPTVSAGVLYAQGVRYAPATPPALTPAPPSAACCLFYNSVSGFYYQASAVGASAGDALLGKLTTSGTAVTGAVAATTVYGSVSVMASAAGSLAVAHLLGRKPVGAVVQMTSSGSIWFQPATLWDAANLYLAASGAGATALVQVW